MNASAVPHHGRKTAAAPTLPTGLGHPESSVLSFWQSSVLETGGSLSNPSITSTFQAGKRQTGEGAEGHVGEPHSFHEESKHLPRCPEKVRLPPCGDMILLYLLDSLAISFCV